MREPFELDQGWMAYLDAFDRYLLSNAPEQVAQARADMDQALAIKGIHSHRDEPPRGRQPARSTT